MKHIKIFLIMFFILISGISVYAVNDNDIKNYGIGYWNFDTNLTYDNASEADWGDTFTNNLLNPTSMLTGTGIYGNSAEINSASDAIQVTSTQFNNMARGQDFTMTCWGYGDLYQPFGVFDQAVGTDTAWTMQIGAEAPAISYSCGAWRGPIIAGPNNWELWTFAYVGANDNITIYRNTTSIYSAVSTGCGSTATTGIGFFNGVRAAQTSGTSAKIDGCMYINKTLSASEINYLWTETKTRNILAKTQGTINNFTISNMLDNYYHYQILNYSAIIDGVTFYSNSTGFIITTILSNYTSTINLNISSEGYRPYINLSYNVSSNLENIRLTPYRTKANITAYNILDNSQILVFNISARSLTSSDLFNVYTTNGTATLLGYENDTYLITILAPNYEYKNKTILFTQPNITSNFSLYPDKSISITIRDEESNALITESINNYMFSDTNSFNKSNDTGFMFINNITAGYYRSDLSGVNYSVRTYYVTIANQLHNTLNAWLLRSSSGSNTKFNIKDNSGDYIENVDISLTKNINGSIVTIGQKNTGISGIAYFTLKINSIYGLVITAPGYTPRNINLEITETEYTIYLTMNSTQGFTPVIGDINYLITPSGGYLIPGFNNISFLVSSPSGFINSFGLGANYSGKIYTGSVSGSPAGGGTSILVNTTGSERDILNVGFNILTQGGQTITLNRSYYLYNITPGNMSIATTLTNFKTDIPQFYRVIMALIISLILGAGFYTFLGTLGSTGVSYLSFLSFGVIGFIPIGYPILVGILVIIGYITTGGNEGT